MNSSYDSHEGGAGTKSNAWIVVLAIVLLAILVVPALLVLGGLWFFGFSRVSAERPVVVEESFMSIDGTAPTGTTGSSVSVNGATATATCNGVTIVAVADTGEWQGSQLSSSDSRMELKLGQRTIVLDHSRLKIDGLDYGEVAQGDQVRLEGGRLTVNGQERKPAAEAPLGDGPKLDATENAGKAP
jgi:hypothetical protein